jgi:hypothetical protein
MRYLAEMIANDSAAQIRHSEGLFIRFSQRLQFLGIGATAI